MLNIIVCLYIFSFSPQLTPYMGKELFGQVVETVIRGYTVYKNGVLRDKPIGELLLKPNRN